MVYCFYMRYSRYFSSYSVCSVTESEWKSQGTNEAMRVVPVVWRSQKVRRCSPGAQPQTKAQTFRSSSSRFIHSAAFFFPCGKTDGEAASKRKWLSFFHDSRHKINWDLPLLLDQVCMIRNKNYSEETNLFSDRIMVLIVSYLYEDLIFCVVRFAINHSHALEQPT